MSIPTDFITNITLSFDHVQSEYLRSIGRLIAKRGLIAHKAQMYRAGRVRMITGTILRDGHLRATNSLRLRIYNAHSEFRLANNQQDRLKKARRLAGRLSAAAFIEPSMSGKAVAAQALVRKLSWTMSERTKRAAS